MHAEDELMDLTERVELVRKKKKSPSASVWWAWKAHFALCKQYLQYQVGLATVVVVIVVVVVVVVEQEQILL